MSRISRVAEQIQRELSKLIQIDITDPRVKLVTVSAIKLSKDMNHAKVYVSTLGDVADIAKTVLVLNGAAAFLRRGLAKSLQLRVTPELRFFIDESFVYSQYISKTLYQENSENNHNDHNDLDNEQQPS